MSLVGNGDPLSDLNTKVGLSGFQNMVETGFYFTLQVVFCHEIIVCTTAWLPCESAQIKCTEILESKEASRKSKRIMENND